MLMSISIISIVSGVLLILLFMFMIISDFCNKLSESVLVLTFFGVAVLGAFNVGIGVASLLEHKEAIQPIEVYRGNTELKIETRAINGEVVYCDTVVVRKK